MALLAVLALAVGGYAAYTAIENSGSNQDVQLREDVGGDVNQAIEQLRGLIEDNTQ